MTNLENALNDYFSTTNCNVYDIIKMIEAENSNQRELLIEIKNLLEWLNREM